MPRSKQTSQKQQNLKLQPFKGVEKRKYLTFTKSAPQVTRKPVALRDRQRIIQFLVGRKKIIAPIQHPSNSQFSTEMSIETPSTIPRNSAFTLWQQPSNTQKLSPENAATSQGALETIVTSFPSLQIK